MKKTIAWHEECVKNMTQSLSNKQIEIKRLEESAYHLADSILSYSEQIRIARTKGISEFDRERFNKKRIVKQ